jgi:hypothetical protein
MLALIDNTRNGKNNRFFLQNNHFWSTIIEFLNTRERLYFETKYSKLVFNKKTMDPSSFSGILNSGLQHLPVTKLKYRYNTRQIGNPHSFSVVQIAYFTPGFTNFKPRKITHPLTLWHDCQQSWYIWQFAVENAHIRQNFQVFSPIFAK